MNIPNVFDLLRERDMLRRSISRLRRALIEAQAAMAQIAETDPGAPRWRELRERINTALAGADPGPPGTVEEFKL